MASAEQLERLDLLQRNRDIVERSIMLHHEIAPNQVPLVLRQKLTEVTAEILALIGEPKGYLDL